jgi:purine-nucleoside phosphorylase
MRQMGVSVLSLATITNRAAGLSRKPLSHQEVITTGQAAGRNLARLIGASLPEVG